VFPVGIASAGMRVRSSRTIRAVTCTDSGCALAFCTLYMVALTGCALNADLFFSGVDEVDEFKKAGLPRRETGLPFGDVSTGVAAKKDDLRCARLWLGVSRELLGVAGDTSSLLDFSASALILCEMPVDTLTLLTTPTLSALT
jgi:hypothetical protein